MSIFMACMGPSYGLSVAAQSLMADGVGRQQVHASMAVLSIVIGVASLAAGSGWQGWRVLGNTRPVRAVSVPQR
jgi:hypothetical protein